MATGVGALHRPAILLHTMQLIRGLGLLVAIACLVWVGVLWRWQSTQRDMSADDILLYLGALPVTLFVLVLASGWAWRGVAQRAAATAEAAPAAGAAPAHCSAGTTAEEAERHATVQLLAAHVASGAGASLDETLDSVAAGAPRPALDDGLRDAQGLPVMAARAKGLEVEATAQRLAALALSEGRDIEPMSESTLRAMALLAPVLGAVVDDLAAWSERLRPRRPQAGAPADTPRRVRVLPVWPGSMSTAQRHSADAWLMTTLQAQATGLVAAGAWVLRPGLACSGPELWLETERLLSLLERDGQDDLVLVTACHSDLDAPTIDLLDNAGKLFGARHPKGVIPGEGAAALVLAGPLWPPAAPDAPPSPHVHRAAIARRDKPVDAAGRVSAELAGELLRQSLVAAQAEATSAAGLACDADQHSPRGAEMHGAALAELSHLEPGDDHCTVGQLSGRTGAVATLMAVAMAARRAVASQRPWVALSVADPHWRLALLARPAAPPASTPAAPAPGSSASAPSSSA